MNKKNKTIIILLIIVIFALLTYIVLLTRSEKELTAPPRNLVQPVISDPGTNIIQARLISTVNPVFVPSAGLYEGALTFKNLNNGELHDYFVCLENLSLIKLNGIYDLPANYYLPHGGPTESMETNGCNKTLKLSINP